MAIFGFIVSVRWPLPVATANTPFWRDVWQSIWHGCFKMKTLLGVLLLLLAGCIFQDPATTIEAIKDRSLTPEAAARTTAGCLPEHAEGSMFQVRDQVPYAGGLLVVFTATCPASDDPSTRHDVVGYAVVKQQQGLWETRFSSWSEHPQQPQRMALLMGQGGPDGQQVVYGWAQNPAVTAVEVTVASGQQHNLPITNQVFHLVLSGADPLCSLTALAADGTVLEQRALPFEDC